MAELLLESRSSGSKPHGLCWTLCDERGDHVGCESSKSMWGAGEEVGFPAGNQGQMISRDPGGASKLYGQVGGAESLGH